MPPGVVAVPYYGRLYRARLGYERIFFFVTVGDARDSFDEVRMGVWDSSDSANLPEWLKKNGVQGVVCTEEPGSMVSRNMETGGIRVITGRDPAAKKLMQNLMI